MSKKQTPNTLIQAIMYFADIDVATEFVAAIRWANGWECPNCGGTSFSYLTTRRLWKCRECKKQTSVKVGTIFEDSPLGLDKWLPAIWLIANSKNGISSHELGRALGVTQKSAWFMLHRIRLAMATGSFEKFSGETEADETFVGGATKNMHQWKRERLAQTSDGAYGGNKTAVAGVLQRNTAEQVSQVHAEVITRPSKPVLHPIVRDHVEAGSVLHTDKHSGYIGLDADYDHSTVDHSVAYVMDRVHTNGMENFWALLKRGIHGTYVQVAPWHMNRYVDERVFTFNERDLTDLGRFSLVLNRVSGRRLTFNELTSKG